MSGTGELPNRQKQQYPNTYIGINPTGNDTCAVYFIHVTSVLEILNNIEEFIKTLGTEYSDICLGIEYPIAVDCIYNGKTLHSNSIIFISQNTSQFFSSTTQKIKTTPLFDNKTGNTQNNTTVVQTLQNRLDELKKQLNTDNLTVKQKQAIMKTIGYTIKQIKALDCA